VTVTEAHAVQALLWHTIRREPPGRGHITDDQARDAAAAAGSRS
jgi:hypothetical protein